MEKMFVLGMGILGSTATLILPELKMTNRESVDLSRPDFDLKGEGNLKKITAK